MEEHSTRTTALCVGRLGREVDRVKAPMLDTIVGMLWDADDDLDDLQSGDLNPGSTEEGDGVDEMLSLPKENFQSTGEVDDVDEMLSLPKDNFQSREDLINAVKKIAFTQGYATTIHRSKAEKLVTIGCDRGGTYRCTKILEERKRKTSSRLISCPFEIRGRKKKAESFWKVEIQNLSHNHEPSTDMSGHPSCRQFSKEEITRIEEMSAAGIPPRQIIAALRQSNPSLLAIARNIYNAKLRILKKSLAGRTVIQALLDELGQAGFKYEIRYDELGHLTHLFFAHPISISLTKSYSNVFVMDCTYKTNKYKMPLLDIIGVTSFNTSFYSCFVFMQKEEEEDYIWALSMFKEMLGVEKYPSVIVSDRELSLMKAINVVFPGTVNLLCVWHIEKNIVANCKSRIKEAADWDAFMSTWNNLINSSSELSFDEAWGRFEGEYKDNVALFSYIKGTWLPMKEKFVHAWTELVPHFGNHATSRAEGAHATLKKYLQVSTGGLREVKEKICLAIKHQFQEIKAELSKQKVSVPHHLRFPLFKLLVAHVSWFALDKLHHQYMLAKSGDHSSQCKGHFSKSMGLPCIHVIKGMRTESLELSSIHEQWRIDTRSFNNGIDESLSGGDDISDILSEFKAKYDAMPLLQRESTKRQLTEFIGTSLPLILEPNIQPHKGRPSGSKNRKSSSSTRRDPSLFELVEKSDGRKCTSCKKSGHNSRTCPK